MDKNQVQDQVLDLLKLLDKYLAPIQVAKHTHFLLARSQYSLEAEIR